MSLFINTAIKKIFVGNEEIKNIEILNYLLWSSNKTISVPIVSKTYTYDGTEQEIVFSGYDERKMEISGTTSATNTGTYTTTFTPKSGYKWEDGETGPKDVIWTMEKATASVTISGKSGEISGVAGEIITYNIDYIGDGEIRVQTSDESIFTVTRSENTVTATIVGSGTGTLSVILSSGTNYTSASVSVSLEITVLTAKAFSKCTWDEINTVCNSGLAAAAIEDGSWTIGDINTNATYGAYSGVRLTHVLTDTQRGSSYYNTTGHIVVEFVNIISANNWQSTSEITTYKNSQLLSTLDAIYVGLNSDFKSVLKTFAPATSLQNSSSPTTVETGIEHPGGHLHAPNCVEVGASNTYRPSENEYSFVFDYYNSSEVITRRNKTGYESYTTWALRSPSKCSSNSDYYVYSVSTNAGESSVDEDKATIKYGISPIGVI